MIKTQWDMKTEIIDIELLYPEAEITLIVHKSENINESVTVKIYANYYFDEIQDYLRINDYVVQSINDNGLSVWELSEGALYVNTTWTECDVKDIILTKIHE